ncbi:type II RES/Xre toxin-antitoxin system antitoxin [Kordia jejudonensis]|uniref:type II RES/Xre toxin-antitoxin system antitoxin n=1 Tax=Kordia jejudonensis TaxID=1348245 RepID=UPI0006291AC3|nr:antitoxin Xre/MbcA/ParS toxin-binding domain-containing protein [Kordia jejudonensis]
MKEKERVKDHLNELQEVLGKEYLKENVASPYDYISIATEGLNANVIKNFRGYFDLSLNETADMLNVSEPSIYRWTKANKTLERNVSIKLFEISELFLLGTEIFGSKDNFFKWLNLPNTALGGMEPQELIEIPEGVSKVRDILGRIEHGVYS